MAFYDDVIALPDLLLYYRLNEADETVPIIDQSPYGHDTAYTNALNIFNRPSLLVGDNDPCLGMMGGITTVPVYAALTNLGNQDFTLFFRTRYTDPSLLSQVIIESPNGTSLGLAMVWYAGDGRFYFAVRKTGGDSYFSADVGSMPAGVDLSFMVTHTVSTGRIDAYVNGIAATPLATQEKTGPFYGSSGGLMRFRGYYYDIDEFFIDGSVHSPASALAFHEAATTLPVTSAGFTISQNVIAAEGFLGTLIEQQMHESGQPALLLEQQIENINGVAGLSIEQVGVESSVAQFNIEQQITGDATSQSWGLVVLLAGVDVSASLTGTVDIDAEESAAMIAEFELEPALGPVALNSWVGAAVSIEYIERDSAGAELWRERLFTGYVDLPIFDPGTGLTLFRCTDGIQNRFDQMSRDDIDALLGGHWSPAVFGDESEGWQYAQQRLKTREASYDIDPSGVGQLTPWAAQVTADKVFLPSQFYDDSLRVKLTPRGNLANQININFDYRFNRYRQREQRYRWLYPHAFITYYQRSNTLPNKNMVQDAVRSSGRTLADGATWTLLPPSYSFMIGSTLVYWVITETLRQQLLLGADFKAAVRFDQTITERYSLTVHANQSQQVFGAIKSERHQNMSASDDREWRMYEQYEQPPASLDHNGDYYDDGTADAETGRAAMTAALQTLLAVARVDILKSHRQNQVSWSCPLQPQLRRDQTIEISSDRVKARGKVYQYRHRFNLTSGAAESNIVIAVSQAQAAGALGDDPIVAPNLPDTRVPLSPTNTTPEIIELGTWLGGDAGSAVFSDAWRGYIGNYGAIAAGSQNYAAQMALESPAIPDEIRDEWEVDTNQDYHVDIPDEYMILEQ